MNMTVYVIGKHEFIRCECEHGKRAGRMCLVRLKRPSRKVKRLIARGVKI